MPRAQNGQVELEYESFGDEAAPTILLINGLGSQMTRWPHVFCEKLAARGYRVLGPEEEVVDEAPGTLAAEGSPVTP